MRLPGYSGWKDNRDAQRMTAEFNTIVSRLHQATSRASQADILPGEQVFGRGMEWTPALYGDYLATHPVNYAAIVIRANAMHRTPLLVVQPDADGAPHPVGRNHPAQRLLSKPNPHMTGLDLMYAIEVQLRSWGKAYLSNELTEDGIEIWPISPPKLTPLPSARDYIQGYIYMGDSGTEKAYAPEEITSLFYYNPMEDRTGLSPIAPLRMTLDMGADAIKYNRNVFRQGGVPDSIFMVERPYDDGQLSEFYDRWEKRFGQTGKPNRPALLSGVTDVKNLAFSNREMEYGDTLRWIVEEVSRIHQVPQPLLGSMREATLANVRALFNWFWTNTMIPEQLFISATLSQDLMPKLGYPDLEVIFDRSAIDSLQEEEGPRTAREKEHALLGIQTVNEIRAARGWDSVDWGDDPAGPASRQRGAKPEPEPTDADQEVDEGAASTRGVSAYFPSLPYEQRNGAHP